MVSTEELATEHDESDDVRPVKFQKKKSRNLYNTYNPKFTNKVAKVGVSLPLPRKNNY